MSKLIGLTGGIATGKSAVSQYLKTKGIPVIDADEIAHRVQEPDHAGFKAIVRTFGETVVSSTGHLDRKTLGSLVFGHQERLQTLVRVMDPYIRNGIIGAISAVQSAPLAVLDAPTLFENGYTYLTDSVMVVYCNPTIQLRRLMARNQLSLAEASARIGSQWPLQTKCDLADTIIYNSGTLAKTQSQIDNWLRNEMKN